MHILSIFFILSYFSVTFAKNSCVFEHPAYGVINITSIGLNNNQPRFRDLSSSSGSYYTYSFNPCYSFEEENCINAAICQVSNDRTSSFTLAQQSSSSWSITSLDTPVLTYSFRQSTVSILMMCSTAEEDTLEVSGEVSLQHYEMHLYSRCACWNQCGTQKSTISPTFTTTVTSPTSATTDVIYYSACMYHDSRFGTIDLSSIGSVRGNATFTDIPSYVSSNIVWSYNPCYKFSEASCHEVSGCRIDKSSGLSYPIGYQQYVSWINMNDSNTPPRSIVYRAPTENRRLVVQLICAPSSPNHQLSVLGETTFNEYTMQLSSPCACWNGCPKPTPDPDDYNWNAWITIGGIAGGVFLFFCMLITCLFCSKPRRKQHHVLIVNEKTPFIKGPENYYG